MAAPQQQQPSAAAAAGDGAELWARVCAAYDRAQASGAASKTDTSTTVVPAGAGAGASWVLRVAAALGAKPRAAPPAAGGGGPPRNPFLPYEEALWVGHLCDSHTLLLNKFNVVPHHVLVVTRRFESQADPLNAADFAATLQVLAAMPRGGVAFYNCGEHSGRSQPHKHVQVVPLPFDDGGGGQQQQPGAAAAAAPVQPLVAAAQAAAGAAALQPFALRTQLPFRAYAVALEPSTTAAQLEATAAQLLALASAGLPAPPSYNVVLSSGPGSTSGFMLLVPRRQEMAGRIAINALGFAGTILLRSQEDLEFALTCSPLALLQEVAQPWESEPAA
ncbi:APA2 [Scenedesmus sp. PABB004]|nr:APA2 [Scenedesmus sp. PABB004]